MRQALLAGVGALAVAGMTWANSPTVVGWVLRVVGGTLGVCPMVADEVW